MLNQSHPQISIRIFARSPSVTIPVYATSGSSGFDLISQKKVELKPGETTLIDTGLCFAIPPGFELQIRSRSGLALKNGIIVLNSPGSVDSDFRGPVGLIIKNTSTENFTVEPNMRVAQGVIAPVFQARFEVVDSETDLGATTRNHGGFGSTGLNSIRPH